MNWIQEISIVAYYYCITEISKYFKPSIFFSTNNIYLIKSTFCPTSSNKENYRQYNRLFEVNTFPMGPYSFGLQPRLSRSHEAMITMRVDMNPHRRISSMPRLPFQKHRRKTHG